MSARAIVLVAAGLVAMIGCGANVRMTNVDDIGLEIAFEEAMALVSDLKYAQADSRFTAIENALAALDHRERAAQCRFWSGYCKEKLLRPAEAADTYRQTIGRYPDTRAAAMARLHLEDIDNSQ